MLRCRPERGGTFFISDAEEQSCFSVCFLGENMENQSCCFIGHRKLQDKENVSLHLKPVIERLITEQGVRVFNFGSRSEFDDLCHLIVSEFQNEYPDIIRVNYNSKSEYVVKKEEKARREEIARHILHKDVTLNDFDQSKISDRVWRAGKASYVERNQEMIDDSDLCVFFYIGEGYKPEPNPYYKTSGKSGTKMAYDYAVRKKKTIINIADMI